MPSFFNASWAIIRGFRPINLLLLFCLHKISQWPLILKAPGLLQDGAGQLKYAYTLNSLMWASLLLAAGGYLINDYYDQKVDRINKPEKASNILVNNPVALWSVWVGLNLLAIILGFTIDQRIEHTQYGFVFIAVCAVLWIYNLSPWSKFLLGPLVISGLIALNLLLIQNLSIYLWAKCYNGVYSLETVYELFATKTIWIWRIALLSFLTNFMRELIKDIEDINGDQNGGRRTLPITIGIARTAKVSMVVGLILIVCIGSMVAIALNYSILLSTQLTVALILAIWITYKCHKIEIPSQAKSVSLWLKILLAIGLLSLFWL